MMRKNLFGTLCALVVSGVAVAATPRMSLRLRGPHTATEEQWRATYGALAANPGCCDEVWFSTGIGVPPLAWHRAQAARLVKAAGDLRKVGVVPSLQFQATLGHSDAISASEDCSAKDWTGWTGSTGVEDRYCNCPRQPAFLAYVREMARIYAAFRPGSVWIDDDLRISNHAPATVKSRLGCWCATCLAAFNAETGGNWTRTSLDARVGGTPAVVESPFVGLMAPHVAAATGALRTVALLNTRIDVQGPLTLRLRGVPAGATAVWREMRRAPVPLVLSREGALSRVTIPEIGAWNGGYVDLVEASK